MSDVTNDARHEKTDLKVFVIVIPKEGLAGWGSANPSLGTTLTIKSHSAVGVIPNEGLAGPRMTMTKILRHIFL